MRVVCFNWKMNGDLPLLEQYSALDFTAVKPIVFPPSTLISQARAMLPEFWAVGGQACHANEAGAHTGCISASMLSSAGASYVLIGHSERRVYESTEFISKSYASAESAGLQPILCVGETLEQRANVHEVLSQQLEFLSCSSSPDLWIAYEPRWAIGTGLTPEISEVAELFSWLRVKINEISPRQDGKILLLYGGSLSAANIQQFLEVKDIDGGLIGGASLKIDQTRDMLKC